MQTATSETESTSRDLNICVHHYILRAACPKCQEKCESTSQISILEMGLAPERPHFRSEMEPLQSRPHSAKLSQWSSDSL